MKRRWISLLAIVALLISMMTCVVIPSTAADTTGSEATSGKVTPTLKQIAKAFYDTINWSGNDDLKQDLVDLYGGNADKGIAIDYEKAIQLVDNGLAGKDLDGNDLTTPLTWKNFNGTTNPYPRFLCHEAYEARGYDGLNWTIAAKEDWYEMDDVAMTADPANSIYFDATGTKYFEGVTFHLKATVNFASADMMPLGAYHGRLFSGTIDGHGYGFENIKISVEQAELTDKVFIGTEEGRKYDMSIGLIGYMGSCTIKNFGIDSGYITPVYARKSVSASTFGCVPAGATTADAPVIFENIWSSCWVFSTNNAYISALFGTQGEAVYDVYTKVNGAVLDGAYLTTSGGANYPGIYMVGGLFTPAATGNEFSNIIFSGDVAYVQETITNDKTPVEDLTVVAAPETKWVNIGMFILDAEASFDANNFKNVYGITGAHKMTNGYLVGVATGIKKGANADSLMTNMSEKELAYALNQTPTEENPVYFTVKNGKIRPTSNAAEKLVKVTVNITDNSEKTLQRVVYAAPKSTVDLRAELGYKDTAVLTGDSITVGTADVTVTLTIDCDHNMEYVSYVEEQRHTATCTLCGHKVDEACQLTNYTIHSVDWNAATHTGDCAKCGAKDINQNCEYQYKLVDGSYKYVCDCGRIGDVSAPMKAGDANKDGNVTLIDAIQVLKWLVNSGVEIDTRNADVDGYNDPEITDVPKIIKGALGDKKIKAEFEAVEKRTNVSNYYDEEKVTAGNLTMAGTIDANKRYFYTDEIAVNAGDKIVFGPVRKAQAVWGYFYDAEGNPIYRYEDEENDLNSVGLININSKNLTIERSFKATVQEKNFEEELHDKTVDGMVMVSVTVPEGAESVRLQLNAKDKDYYYIRINNRFTLEDYQYRVNGDANTLTNPMKDQLFLTVGDSLCSANNDTTPEGGQKGWAARIKRDFGVDITNPGTGGSALSTIRFIKQVEKLIAGGATTEDDLLAGDSMGEKQCIVNQITMRKGEGGDGREYEFVLLEGGGNDASQDGQVGYWLNDDESTGVCQFNQNSYDPADFAPEYTYLGGLERAIYSIIKQYGDTVAIGYMSIYPITEDTRFADMNKYFQYAQMVCDKWGVEYLDLFTEMEDFDNPNYTWDGSKPDYIHANGPGYDQMQEHIHPFVYEDMKPISQKVYLEVQKYDPIPKKLGNDYSVTNCPTITY